MFDDFKDFDYIDNLDGKNPKIKFQLGLKIASLNVRGLIHYHSQRLALYLWMVKNDIDIMLLQEWYLHHRFGSRKFDMTLYNGYRLIDNERNTKTLILHKSQLMVEDLSNLICEEDGIDITWCAIKTKRLSMAIASFYHRPGNEADKIKYDIIYNHMNQIKRSCNYNDLCFFIAGDFNGKNVNWGSTITDDRGKYIIDWMVDKNLDFINDGSFTHKHSTTGKEDVLDLSLINMDKVNLVTNWYVQKDIYYILQGKKKNKKNDNNFNQHQIHQSENRKQISDHYGMITEMRFDPICNDIPVSLTWNFNKKKIKDFKKLLIKYMEEWKASYDIYWRNINYIDSLTDLFQLLIFKAGYNVFGLKKHYKNMINTVSIKTKKLMSEKHKKGNKLSNILSKIKKRYHGTPPLFLKKKKKKLRKEIKKLNNKINKSKSNKVLKSTLHMEAVINDPDVKVDKVFWKMVDKISNTKENYIPPIRNDKSDKVIATTTQEIANCLHMHFIKEPKRNKYEQKHINYHNKVNNKINNYSYNKNNNNSILNRKISKQEILKVINSINKNSAMGFDFMHYQLISWAKDIILSNLTLLFNLCYYHHQKCPQAWKKGEYVPIRKPGRIPYYCKNIRPITILPGLARILNKVISNRILTDCINRKLINTNNIAFQKNKCAENIVLDYVEKIYRSFQNGHFLELTITDLGWAYDSVWKNGLINKLIDKYNYNGNLIAWLLEYLSNRMTRVVYNGFKTPWRKSLDNLPQGSTLSTILFILFLNFVDIGNKKQNKFWKKKHQILEKRKSTKENKNDNNKNENNLDEMKMISDCKNEHEIAELLEMERSNFRVEFANFADDGTLCMVPSDYKCDLTDKIKYNYRFNMQYGINMFFNWTRFNQLIIKDSKCSSISFCNKKDFTAYVYKLDGKNLELIHAHDHAPQDCKHRQRLQYTDGLKRLDDNYFENLKEGNGNLDLKHLSNDGKPTTTKTNKYYNKYDDINKIDRPSKNQKQIKNKNKNCKIHELPESIRLLGVHLDPRLYLNEHIEITLEKAERKLYCLHKMAKCKYYNFSSMTIFKLFESVIRPKLEYALCTVSSSKKWYLIEQIQKRAYRMVLKAKPDTSTLKIKEILNYKSMSNKLHEAQVKLWHKYKRAPSSMLQYFTFKFWKLYILNNGENVNLNKNLRSKKLNTKEQFNINSKTFNFVSKSPLSRAYEIIRQITPHKQPVFSKRCPSVVKPPPTYTIPFPNNINITNATKKNYQHKMDKSNNTVFFSDGSCKPNPGPGGAGYYSPNFDIESKMDIINHDTTINYCELFGIWMILKDYLNFVNYHFQLNNILHFKNIQIFTDSQFVCKVLNINGFPEFDGHYKLIQKIFIILSKLKIFNIGLEIIKIPSHSGIEENNTVDGIANRAATIAKDCKYGKSNFIKYNQYFNPVHVDISIDLKRLHYKHKKDRLKEWKLEQQNWNSGCLNENMYQGNMIFHRMILGQNNHIKRSTNDMKNELRFLKPYESSIITKLRTECINLNGYKNFRFKDENLGLYELCRYCKVPETVKHFLIDCPGQTNKDALRLNPLDTNYNASRNILKYKLSRIDSFFRNRSHFNVENLLFPHTWQIKPKRDDKYYKIKIMNGHKRRVYIFKEIIAFIQRTKRFNREKFGI